MTGVTGVTGVLLLQVFDCSFLEDEVKYIHNGSPQLDEDSVMLRVYRSVSASWFLCSMFLMTVYLTMMRRLHEP